MNITLPREQQEWLEAQVKAGVYQSVDDALARFVAEHMELDLDDLEWAKPLLDEARASIARGRHDARRTPSSNDGALRQARPLMAKITISPEADQDTADIVARRNPDSLFERLAMFPRSGASRPHLGHSIRIGVVAPYVSIYELDEDHVIVLRVLDGRRNITRRLIHQ